MVNVEVLVISLVNKNSLDSREFQTFVPYTVKVPLYGTKDPLTLKLLQQ